MTRISILSFILLSFLVITTQIVYATTITSINIYPSTTWVRLENDYALYQIAVVFSPEKGEVRLNITPKSIDGISTSFNPQSGRPVTGVFASILNITTSNTTPPGLYSFNITVTVGEESKLIKANLKVVPPTPDGASLVLYDFYSKVLSPDYWINEGNYALNSFASDFGSSFTNPVSLLKKFAAGTTKADLLTTAENLAKESITVVSYLSNSQIAATLSSVTSSEITIDKYWEVKELKDISSLIERGDKSTALNEIQNLILDTRIWSQRINSLEVNGLTVTERSKEFVKNLVLSLQKFLEEEKERLSSFKQGPDIVLAIDTSGSMNDVWAGEKKIDSAKKSAISLVKTLPPEGNISLVSFDTSARLELPLASNRSKIIDVTESLTAGGETNMGDALVKSLNELKRGKGSPKAIIFFTDGRLNIGMNEREILSGPVKEAEALGIKIYTVGYGDPSELNEEFLKEMAERTGGKYYYSGDTFNLENDFIETGQLASAWNLTLKRTGKIEQGERKTFSVSLSKIFDYVKFILNWRGSNLDLRVIDQNGNVMNDIPNARYSGDTKPEYLVISKALPGTYRIEVYGKNVTGEEEYALWVFTSPTYVEVSGGGMMMGGGASPTETHRTTTTTIRRGGGGLSWTLVAGIGVAVAAILLLLFGYYGRAPAYYLTDPSGRLILRTSEKDRIYGREDFQMVVGSDKRRYISRRIKGGQFRIFRSGKDYYIVDTSTANPTIVNGMVIRGRGPIKLENGSRIQVEGALDLLFYYS